MGIPREGTSRAEESGGEKKQEKENQLKRTKSRELRGGVMYYSCHCIKRNGLQHDCRRTGCGGEPACLHLPDPLCAPSQLTRARGLADPAPLAAHLRAQEGGGAPGSSGMFGGGSGKKFIVCELKGIIPDAGANKSGKCCKCPSGLPPQTSIGKCSQCAGPSKGQSQGPSGSKIGACVYTSVPVSKPGTVSAADKKCPCKGGASAAGQGVVMFDEKTIDKIFASFENKDVHEFGEDVFIGPGGRPRKVKPPVVKEPCTREGCVHWQPPPPCCWDAPCKADCFETPPGIRPGRNPLTGGGGGGVAKNVTSGGIGQGTTTFGSQQSQKLLGAGRSGERRRRQPGGRFARNDHEVVLNKTTTLLKA